MIRAPAATADGDDLTKKKVEGKAFQVNQNSVDNPTSAPVTPIGLVEGRWLAPVRAQLPATSA